MNWKKAAIDLWQMLDTIDTFSDMYKPAGPDSYKAYYHAVTQEHQKRFKVLTSDGYDLFTMTGGKVTGLQ